MGTPSYCEIVKQARNHGFDEILGPGCPGHSTHARLGSQSSRYRSASSCGF